MRMGLSGGWSMTSQPYHHNQSSIQLAL